MWRTGDGVKQSIDMMAQTDKRLAHTAQPHMNKRTITIHTQTPINVAYNQSYNFNW